MIACPNMAPVSPTRSPARRSRARRGVRPLLPITTAVLALSACASPTLVPPGPRVVAELTPDGVRLEEGGRPVLFYRSRPEPEREPWRVHYVHPLHSVGGAILTEDAPADHVHHRGVFWAWRRILVDGVDVTRDAKQAKRRIAVVPQVRNLDRDLTVREWTVAGDTVSLIVAGPDAPGDAQALATDLAAAYGGPVTLDVEYVPTTRQQVEAAP